MKHLSLLIGAALLASACGKSEAPKAAEPAPAAEAPAAAAAAPAAPAAPSAEAPAAAAPATYSAEAAAKLLTEMEACKSKFNCPSFKTLVGFGQPAAAELAKLATDAAKPAGARGLAAEALTEIKDPAQGVALFAAAKAETSSRLRRDLFEAAGASGSEEVLKAAGEFLLTEDGYKKRLELSKAIVPFGAKASAWAAQMLADPKVKETFHVALADIIKDTAQKDDLAKVQELLKSTKDQMAKHRLAVKALELGDATAIEVMWAGMADKDEFVVLDAALQIGGAAKSLSPEHKAKAVELLTAAQAKSTDKALFGRALDQLK
jgi:hypothetical protein